LYDGGGVEYGSIANLWLIGGFISKEKISSGPTSSFDG
jgi:hypothetical protein